jgi:Uma2 family endonuclease
VANGAKLGWLIDADVRRVYIYRPDRNPEELLEFMRCTEKAR